MAHAGKLFIGLMSGTSMDGIDAALVWFESVSTLKVVETAFTPFPDDLRRRVCDLALNNARLHNNNDSPLHQELATHYARASTELLSKASIEPSEVVAIANHGQTVRHEPNHSPPFSVQLGDGQLIANLTGIKTITQFRQADLAAGGQGAPLMPAFHNAVFGKQSETCFVLNLGGIANITQLGRKIIGFDTGPANCLLDQWIERHKGQRFDQDGSWASSGTAHETLVKQLLQDPYFARLYPKSTGTDYFNLDWLSAHIKNLNDYAPADVQASLLKLTVDTIGLALSQLDAHEGALYVCGGGAQNQYLMATLRTSLEEFEINNTSALGVPSDWVEAAGFAWLGYCHEHSIPSNLPTVTGASTELVLGESFLPC